MALSFVVVACGSSDSEKSGKVTSTPTDVVVSWTIAGAAPTDASCAERGGVSVYVSMSATIDTELHHDTTASCAEGQITFPGLIAERLGQPYIDAILLDASGKTVAMASSSVIAAATTELTLEFFPAPGSTSSSSSTSSTSSSSSTGVGGGGAGGGGIGGDPSTSSSTGAGGAGGDPSTSSSTGAGGAGGST